MLRVGMLSLGQPARLDLTLTGDYSLSGAHSRALASGTAVAVSFSAQTGRFTLVLPGETLDADAALACGLLDRMGDLDDALATAAHVAQLAPLSVRYSKRVLNDALEPELPAMRWTDEAVLEGWFSVDFREGKLAAAEKRRPRFQGR